MFEQKETKSRQGRQNRIGTSGESAVPMGLNIFAGIDPALERWTIFKKLECNNGDFNLWGDADTYRSLGNTLGCVIVASRFAVTLTLSVQNKGPPTTQDAQRRPPSLRFS